MTALRSHKHERQYKDYRKRETDSCPFCDVTPKSNSYVEETATFLVVRNNFPYTLWEGQGVDMHLMVVPKEHTNTLSDLSDAQSKEYLELLQKYEENGYNLYMRSLDSTTRTVAHHHTHLIKTDNKMRKFLLMLKWPKYIRASF
jgi:diadenosine tetraphosphate (Ap4A) HIT family hydrolase